MRCAVVSLGCFLNEVPELCPVGISSNSNQKEIHCSQEDLTKGMWAYIFFFSRVPVLGASFKGTPRESHTSRVLVPCSCAGLGIETLLLTHGHGPRRNVCIISATTCCAGKGLLFLLFWFPFHDRNHVSHNQYPGR